MVSFNNPAPTLPPPVSGGSFSETFISVAHEDSVKKAVTRLNNAGGGVLYFAAGSYGAEDTLNITVPHQIIGEGATSSTLYAAPGFSGEDLIYVHGTAPITGVELRSLRVSDANRHNVHYHNVRTFTVADVISHDATQDGYYLTEAWNGDYTNVQAWRNGRDGLNGEILDVHAISLNSVHAAENMRYGIVPPSLSIVNRPVLEFNGVAGLRIVDRSGITTRGGYFEDHTGTGNHHHLHVSNAKRVALRDVPALQWGPNDAVVIDGNSDEIIVDGLHGSHPITAETAGDYQWGALSNGSRGFVVTHTVGHIGISGVTPTPIFVASPRAVELGRFDGILRPNLIGPDGAFTTPGTPPGLGAGWTHSTGTPTPTLVNVEGIPYQRLTATAGFDTITHPVTLKANTTYTVGAIVKNNGNAYFCGDHGGNRLFDDISPINRPRLVAYQFTTGSQPYTQIGLTIRATGTVIDLAEFKVVEGAFNASTFPRFGQYEG